MRTSKSIKNASISFITYTLTVFISFIAQRIFIFLLNEEYLGLNSLLSNIISILSIAELGIGEAIIFNLYNPISKNDYNQINKLLKFYKKSYQFIAAIIFILGLCLITFLGFFVGNLSINVNIQIVFILFLLQTVFTYLFSYKRSILFATQNNYIITIVHFIYVIFLNVFQLSILYFTRDFYLYLIIKIIFTIVENIIVNFIANKKFSYLDDNFTDKLDKETEKDIYNRIKALMLHKVGGAVVNGTDNLFISKFINVVTVGLYSNYFLIINSVRTLFSQILNSITASVGNLLVESDSNKSFDIYKKIRFLNFIVSSFTSICLLLLLQPFIVIWLGDKFLLSYIVIVILIINHYQKMMRSCNDTFMVAAGICVENRFVPILESILNIIFSYIFVKIFGLAGVFMGTIISGLALWCYSYPKFVYKKLFNRSYLDYAKETLGYILLFILLAGGTYYLSTFFVFNNVWIQLFVNALIAVIVPNVILVILFWRTEEFKYFFNLGMNILSKIKNKILKHA